MTTDEKINHHEIEIIDERKEVGAKRLSETHREELLSNKNPVEDGRNAYTELEEEPELDKDDLLSPLDHICRFSSELTTYHTFFSS